MTVGAVEEQAAMNLLIALFCVQAVVGGQHEHGMAAEPKQLTNRLAPQIVRAGVVRRIEIGQNQNFHRPNGTLRSRLDFGESDGVTHLDAARFDDLGQHSLAPVFHQFAQARADLVHAPARRAHPCDAAQDGLRHSRVRCRW